jgi:hypothetical protein
MNMIDVCKRIFEEDNLGLTLRTYEILVTSATSGILGLIYKKLIIIFNKNYIYKNSCQILCQLIILKNYQISLRNFLNKK